MTVSNIARRVQRAQTKSQRTAKKTAIETQRKGALMFGITGTGTLVQALLANERPAHGITKLPPGVSYTLIEAGKVWVNNEVCIDPTRALKPGDHIAVFPNEQMQLVRDMQGRSSIRMRAGFGAM